jgi:hypothetical protein
MASSRTHLYDGPDHVPQQANSDTYELPAVVGPKTGRSRLGVDFQPSDLSVICGQGKENYNHEGNHCLRILASVFVGRYSRADCKTSKSAVVFNIVARIRQMGGHFCKYEKGAWFEVGDRCARGKVSSLLRDMLHTQYRSSAKAKIIRRRAQNRNETQTQHDGQQLADVTGGHSEHVSSMASSHWGESLDFLGGTESLTEDYLFDMDIF